MFHSDQLNLFLITKIVNIDNGAICATGKTVQVFLSVKERVLELNTPDFYQKWKTKYIK